ncbi:MAG: hypothetical protein ABEJ28_03265 [Salinigranum sp.]
MSLSTDALLFSIVLVLVAVQTALPFDGGSTNFLLAGLGIAVVALLGSVVTSTTNLTPGATDGENSER